MSGFFQSIFAVFLTWWGVFALAALDSSMLFFLPFGIDTAVIYMAARSEGFFWVYPLLATGGSMTGAALTFWIGRKVGDAGLERLVSGRQLERIRGRVRDKGAVALAVPALLPPPFPLTPFVLVCGALKVDPARFFITLGSVRVLRFGAEAVLARLYGRGILRVLRSDGFQTAILVFAVIAVVGTVASAVMLWRSTRDKTAGRRGGPAPA